MRPVALSLCLMLLTSCGRVILRADPDAAPPDGGPDAGPVDADVVDSSLVDAVPLLDAEAPDGAPGIDGGGCATHRVSLEFEDEMDVSAYPIPGGWITTDVGELTLGPIGVGVAGNGPTRYMEGGERLYLEFDSPASEVVYSVVVTPEDTSVVWSLLPADGQGYSTGTGTFEIEFPSDYILMQQERGMVAFTAFAYTLCP